MDPEAGPSFANQPFFNAWKYQVQIILEAAKVLLKM